VPHTAQKERENRTATLVAGKSASGVMWFGVPRRPPCQRGRGLTRIGNPSGSERRRSALDNRKKYKDNKGPSSDCFALPFVAFCFHMEHASKDYPRIRIRIARTSTSSAAASAFLLAAST